MKFVHFYALSVGKIDYLYISKQIKIITMNTQVKKHNTETMSKIMELIYDIKNIRSIMRHSQPDPVWDRLSNAWSQAARAAFKLAEELEGNPGKIKLMIHQACSHPVGQK